MVSLYTQPFQNMTTFSMKNNKKKIQDFFWYDYPSDVDNDACELYIQYLELEIKLTQAIIDEDNRQRVRSD